MFSVHRKKISLVLIFTFLFGTLLAQTREIYSPDFDNKTIRFGFGLGLLQTHYEIDYNKSFSAIVNSPDSLRAISSRPTTVLNAMGTINFYINERFDFRFSPLSIALYSRKLALNNNFTETQSQNTKAYFEIPMLLKFKSERRRNSRAYLFGGLKFGFETNIFKKKGTNFFTRSNDLALEYGMGLEFFRPYFNFCPELHFSTGLVNQIDPVNSKQSPFLRHINRLKNHTVGLIFAFQ